MELSTEFLNRVIEREGGYVDHPQDRGGPTKYGITQKTLSAFWGSQASAEDVEQITQRLARMIYDLMFWKQPGFDKLDCDENLAELLFDTGVNHGTVMAVTLVQRVVGVNDDGILGPITRRAVNTYGFRKLFIDLLATRIEFYGRIVQGDSSQAVFITGWLRRMNHFLQLLM